MTSTLTIAHITQKQIQRLQRIQNCTVPLINPPEREDYNNTMSNQTALVTDTCSYQNYCANINVKTVWFHVI